MRAVLFLVVGPSGVGKDTLLDGAREALGHDPDFVFARRVITRPADSGGEIHEAMDAASFAHAARSGAFILSWEAHGLSYGIRRDVIDRLAAGQNVLLNASRRTVEAFCELWPATVVLSVTAPSDIIEERLQGRGRETPEDRAMRLARAAPAESAATTLAIDNAGTVREGRETLIAAVLSQARLTATARTLADASGDAPACSVHPASTIAAAAPFGTPTHVTLHAGQHQMALPLVVLSGADASVLDRRSAGLAAPTMHRLGLRDGEPVVMRALHRPAATDRPSVDSGPRQERQ